MKQEPDKQEGDEVDSPSQDEHHDESRRNGYDEELAEGIATKD